MSEGGVGGSIGRYVSGGVLGDINGSVGGGSGMSMHEWVRTTAAAANAAAEAAEADALWMPEGPSNRGLSTRPLEPDPDQRRVPPMEGSQREPAPSPLRMDHDAGAGVGVVVVVVVWP